MIDPLHDTPSADPDQKVLVHGDPEDQRRKARMANGIPIPPAVAEHVRQL